MNEWHEKEINTLLGVLAQTTEREDIEVLLEKVLTPREINDAARRLEVLRLLNEGESYSSISSKLKMSAGTIAKISLGLGYGFRRTDNKISGDNHKRLKTKTLTIVQSRHRYKGAPSFKIKYK